MKTNTLNIVGTVGAPKVGIWGNNPISLEAKTGSECVVINQAKNGCNTKDLLVIIGTAKDTSATPQKTPVLVQSFPSVEDILH